MIGGFVGYGWQVFLFLLVAMVYISTMEQMQVCEAYSINIYTALAA